MNHNDRIAHTMLKGNLLQLNKQQLKQFYGILVHAWASQKAFISNQNFRNLWCELNCLCAEVDEGFPAPYDDYDLLRSFCRARPYYFIDILAPELVLDLFCRYLDDRLNVLAKVVNKLSTEGLRAAYECVNDALGLAEDVDRLAAEGKKHIAMFS